MAAVQVGEARLGLDSLRLDHVRQARRARVRGHIHACNTSAFAVMCITQLHLWAGSMLFKQLYNFVTALRLSMFALCFSWMVRFWPGSAA